MATTQKVSIAVGDRVKEAGSRVPQGCEPFYGEVTFVAEDGWVGVRFPGGHCVSFPPHEVVRAD